jgi:hypothetical protein
MLILTDVTLIVLAIVFTIGFCVIGFLSTCYCCCYNPLAYLFKSLFQMRKRDSTNSPIIGQPTYVNANYQIIPVVGHESESFGYQSTSNASASAPSAPPISMMMPEVEAYMIPPLLSHQERFEKAYNPYAVSEAVHVSPSIVVETPIMEKSTNGSSANVPSFKDKWAALLFIINIIILLYFSLKSSVVISNQPVGAESTQKPTDFDWKDLSIIAYLALGFTTTAIIVSYTWLHILLSHAHMLIDLVLKANIVCAFTSAIVCLLSMNVFASLVLFVSGCLNIWYYFSVQDRIPFASAVLGVASKALNNHFTGIMSTAYGMLFFQLLWFALWSVASYGIVSDPYYFSKQKKSSSADDDVSFDGMQIGLVFLLLLSLYWGVQVIKYMLQTTVAGTIACWWFQPERKHVVRGSLFRASTTSFGSICFGALLVAIIQASRELVNMIRNQRRRRRNRSRSSSGGAEILQAVIFCCAECILKLLEDVLVYINRFAFCYVAAYGYGFIESGQKVYELFKQR